MSSLLSYVWLSLKRGLGNYLRAEVLRRMGSPEAVYAADSTMLAQSCPSLRRQHIELLCDKSTDEAEQVITQCAREDIRILGVREFGFEILLFHVFYFSPKPFQVILLGVVGFQIAYRFDMAITLT